MEEGILYDIFMFKFSSGLFLVLVSLGAHAAVQKVCAPQCLDYVSGAFAGLGLGYQSSSFRAQPHSSNPFFIGVWDPKKSVQYSELQSVSSTRSSMQGIVGDLNFGWDARFRFSNIVMGFILGAQARGGSGQLSYPVVSAFPSADDPNVSSIKAVARGIKIAAPWAGYAAFRFGVTVGRALIHTKVGFAYNYLTSEASAPDRAAGALPAVDAKNSIIMKSNHWVPSFLGGIGIDFRISRSVVFYSNFDINVGSKTQLKFNNPKAANTEVSIPIQGPDGRVTNYTYVVDPQVSKVSTRPILFVAMIGIRYFLPNR